MEAIRRVSTSQGWTKLFRNALTFYNVDIKIDGKLREAVNPGAGGQPFDFNPIDFGTLADSEDEPRVMRGKVTASGNFLHPPLQVARLPGDAGSNRLRAGLRTFEMKFQPVMEFADVVLQQDRSALVGNHQHINAAIVIEVSIRQAAPRDALAENRTALVAYILIGLPIAGAQVSPEKGIFEIVDLTIPLRDLVIRMA